MVISAQFGSTKFQNQFGASFLGILTGGSGGLGGAGNVIGNGQSSIGVSVVSGVAVVSSLTEGGGVICKYNKCKIKA